MGIETNLERIANALGTIAEVQSRMLIIAEWNKDRLSSSGDPEPAPEALSSGAEQEPVKAEIRTAPADPQVTYDHLKAALIERGIMIPKGTKMTTLVKLWEKHQSDPVLPPEEKKQKEENAE